MTNKALLKSKKDELISEYNIELRAELDHAQHCAALSVTRYQEAVDKSLKEGAASLDHLVQLTIRLIKNERDYFIIRTRERLEDYKLQFEFFMIQYPRVRNKLLIREEFEERLRRDRNTIQNILSHFFFAYMRKVGEYKVKELKQATKKRIKMIWKTRRYFAKVDGRELAKRITITTPYQTEEEGGKISVEEYEGRVRWLAESYSRQRTMIVSTTNVICVEMGKLAMKCIDESLLNGCAVFDVFTKIPDLAINAMLSAMIEGIDKVKEKLTIHTKHLHSLCVSEIAPMSLFGDLILEGDGSAHRKSSDQIRATNELLRIYRKDDREKATATFEHFKKSAGMCAIKMNFNVNDLINLNNYEMVEIGRGGQASVYSLEMEIEGNIRKVAAKKYTKGSGAEISLCGATHPNIASYLTAAILNNDIYLIAEFCPSTLAVEMEKHPSELRARNYVIQYISEIVEGMEFLRMIHLYHGDLKPENILIGEDGAVKLADFGISLVPDEIHNYRRDCDWSGTPEYMAPELFRAITIGSDSLELCDVWSFGICVWEMMTRRRPYHGIERQRLLKIIGEDCKHPELPNSSNLESLVNLLRKCWNKNNPDRPKFHQIAEELKDVYEEMYEMDEEEWRAECALWNPQRIEEKEVQEKGENDVQEKEIAERKAKGDEKKWIRLRRRRMVITDSDISS